MLTKGEDMFSTQVIERKMVLEENFIQKMKERNYSRTAVNQMIGGLCHSISVETQRNITTKEAIQKLISGIEKDFGKDTDKPLLEPRDNREYWLFTEFHQRLKNLQNEISDETE